MEKFDLGWNKLDDDWGLLIASSLENITNLKEINFDDNKFGIKFCKKFK